MKKCKSTIIGIGELLWDVFPEYKRAGGAPINFVYHATRLGAEGYAISAVGRDELGTEILKELKENKIENCTSKVDYPTGYVKVELHNGCPSYTIVEGVAWDHIPLTPQAIELMKKADAVCFGTLAQRAPESGETIRTLLSYVPENALRFFDINIRQHYYTKEVIEESLRLANVFKINDDELEILRPMFSLEGTDDEVCRWFIKTYSLRFCILTAGAAYSTIYTSKRKSCIKTPRVKVKDTVGAGDSFSGAFVYSKLAGRSLRVSHRKAVKTAAFVCKREGAWPSYPVNKGGK